MLELRAIRQELTSLRCETRESLPPPIVHPYLEFIIRGILQGFGTVVGATVVVSIFLYILAQIDFIPIVSDWIQMIVKEMQIRH
ncbi:MAG: hypothetical protein HQL93_05765 [Magnetococcales bacterium]|nr:hypothetical protein [Magnetococcales bacterium]